MFFILASKMFIFFSRLFDNCDCVQLFTDLDKHIVVSAPTGSGKTIILELAITELLIYLQKTVNDFPATQTNAKIIYSMILIMRLIYSEFVLILKKMSILVGPTKSLCREIYRKWQTKFKYLNLKTCLVTGDTTEFNDFSDLNEYNIIVTTAEKIYSMLRLWNENKQISISIELILIDEVHILNEEKRGAMLEALISRLKCISWLKNDLSMRNIRFIAISGTISNVDQIGNWLKSQTKNDFKIFK